MTRLFVAAFALFMPLGASAEEAVTTFSLDNGMDVVVIEDQGTSCDTYGLVQNRVSG